MAVETQIPQGLDVVHTFEQDAFDAVRESMAGLRDPCLSFRMRNGSFPEEYSFFRATERRIAAEVEPIMHSADETLGARRHYVLADTTDVEPAGTQRAVGTRWHADTPLVYLDLASDILPTRVLYRQQGDLKRAVGERALRRMVGGRRPKQEDIQQMIADRDLFVFSAKPREALRLAPGIFHASSVNETDETVKRVLIQHAFSGYFSFRMTGAVRRVRSLVYDEAA